MVRKFFGAVQAAGFVVGFRQCLTVVSVCGRRGALFFVAGAVEYEALEDCVGKAGAAPAMMAVGTILLVTVPSMTTPTILSWEHVTLCMCASF